MPRLSCWQCGRQIYTVAPLEALFAEERRCPRCGAFLREDRREAERRTEHRRKNPHHDPGPPNPKAPPQPRPATTATSKPASKAQPKPQPIEADATDGERRVAERRTVRRRGGGA
jgi:hypothetical protein